MENHNDIVDDETRKKVYRKLERTLASSILSEMARTDTSLEYISVRTKRSYREIKENLDKLIEGDSFKESLDFISDVFLSMGGELVWKVDSDSSSNDPSHITM